MARTRKPTQSEIDGVQYRRAKLWQIILYSCNAFVGMSVYSLIGYANYAGMHPYFLQIHQVSAWCYIAAADGEEKTSL